MRPPATVEQQYLYAILEEQKKTNALLRQLVGEKKTMKRPELLKLIKEIPNKPKGWQKWPNDKLINFAQEEGVSCESNSN